MRLNEVLPALAGCLCEQIEADGNGSVCFCGVVPGSAMIADYGGEDCDEVGCGSGWVRLAAMYPSQTVGIADQSLGNCGIGIGVDIEVGLVRCFGMDEQPPTEEEVLEATMLQMADAETVRKAIQCCGILRRPDYILGQYTPIGPQGGLLGGSWIVHVGL